MFVLGVPNVLSEGVNKIIWKKKFIGVSATKSQEKSRILSKRQKTTGGGQTAPQILKQNT